MEKFIKAALVDARHVLDNLINNTDAITQINASAEALVKCFEGGQKLISCGNGGSMCDAMHLAEELTGRFRQDRKPLAAMAISDPGHLSCVSNDFGYQDVFSRYVQALGKPGDLFFGISTSGKSKNVIAAAHVARQLGMVVIALTGRGDSELGAHSDIEICTPGLEHADRVQEMHIKVIHILIELVERKLFPGNYVGTTEKANS